MNIDDEFKMILARLDENADKYIDKIESIGIITETELSVSKTLFSLYLDEIEILFRNRGYSGGSLLALGTEISNEGWMYALFDSDKISHSQCISYLKEFYG